MRSARSRLGAAMVLVAACGVAALAEPRAYADASAPPPFPTNCPGPQNPPAGYFNPTPAQPTPPPTYTGPTYKGPVPYEIPFKAIINGGDIELPPNVRIPHLYASLCGLISAPTLAGTIAPDNINFATPNVYIAGLEALPATVAFGKLQSSIDLTPAHNGGLDITISGETNESVSTLGMTCGLTLNALFTTQTDGALSGQPVTGPTEQGQAEAVSNSFDVPAVQTSDSCPPSIAQTFTKLLGLPAPAGVGKFSTPFCFDFELEGVNSPKPTSQCPWPSS